MSIPGYKREETSYSALCKEISGNITFVKNKVHITYSGTLPKLLADLLFKIIHIKLFRLYKENHLKLRTSQQTLSFYFTLFHHDQEFGIQCFLGADTFRLFIYTSQQNLPWLFHQVEKVHEEQERSRTRELLEQGIIRDDIISLFYQPIIKIDAQGSIKSIKGAEAFLRVKDQGEYCTPGKYLAVAEDEPQLMRRLGFKILELACSDLKVFKKKYPLFTVSLNVSEKQFAPFDDAITFESIFAEIKKQYDVERHDIALEVPEVTTDINSANYALLKRLFDDGTPIILDDFTLGAIIKNPAVEIDKYKVSTQMTHDSFFGNEKQKYQGRDFLRQVFAAARQYGKSVVVKGVEAYEQIPVLLDLGFAPETDLLQGNLFCPPMDLQSFEYIYKDNVIRQFKSHMMDLLKHAEVRVLYQQSPILETIGQYFRQNHLSANISMAQSFSELWTTEDRNLVVIMGYDFVSHIVSQDQLKDTGEGDDRWQQLIDQGALFEIPGLPMALINNFQDKDRIGEQFEMVEEYDGHNLYQILISINKEKTEKIPFIILSETDTEMQHLEENVLILNNLESLEDFENLFVQSLSDHPETIGKFNRL